MCDEEAVVASTDGRWGCGWMVSPMVDAIGCPLCFVSVGNVHDILIHIQIVEVQSVGSCRQVAEGVSITVIIIGICDSPSLKICPIGSFDHPEVWFGDVRHRPCSSVLAKSGSLWPSEAQIDISPRIVVILEIDPVTWGTVIRLYSRARQGKENNKNDLFLCMFIFLIIRFWQHILPPRRCRAEVWSCWSRFW